LTRSFSSEIFKAFSFLIQNSQKMRKEVTDQVKLNLEYWKEEIPKEVKLF